jgi:hypothetical protein
MYQKMKYVRLEEHDQFIFFPEGIQHSKFKHWNVKSAGFCNFDIDPENSQAVVRCWGESISLNVGSMEDDSELATNQINGGY